MRSYSITTLLALAVLLPLQAALAQEKNIDSSPVPLTLHQVWERAELFNKSIRMKQILLEKSEEQIKGAYQERLPEINVDGDFAKISNMPVYTDGLFSKADQFHVLHTTYTLGADAYLNLYNGNKVNLEIKAKKQEKQIAVQQKKLTVSEAKLRSAVYYLDMQRSHIFKELLIKDIASQKRQIVQIQTLFANGVVLKSDVLQAEIKLSRQELTLVQLENDLQIANQKLNMVIGFPDDQRIDVIDPVGYESVVLKPYDAYLTEADENSYPLKISEMETQLKALALKNVKANILPKIGLFAQYKYSYPQIFLYPYEAAIYGIGLAGFKASFSVSALYNNKHKVSSAKLDYHYQELEHEQVQDDNRQKVKEAYLRYQEALNRIGVLEKNVIQAVENHRIITNTYFNQLSLITDLLNADTALLQTRFDLAAAKIAGQLQYYQLQNITGNL